MANRKKSAEEKQNPKPMYFENWIWEKIKAYAEKEQISGSAYVRKAVIKYFEKEEGNA